MFTFYEKKYELKRDFGWQRFEISYKDLPKEFLDIIQENETPFLKLQFYFSHVDYKIKGDEDQIVTKDYILDLIRVSIHHKVGRFGYTMAANNYRYNDIYTNIQLIGKYRIKPEKNITAKKRGLFLQAIFKWLDENLDKIMEVYCEKNNKEDR